jgi:RND superfamily putative drug exporter
VEATLRADNAVRSVVPPAPGISISRDGHTAIVQAGVANSSNGMVTAADALNAGQPHGDDEVSGAVAENHDLQSALSAKTPLVIGVVLALGCLLLLIALQAPLLAAVGVLTNLLATGAAFGVAKWIFQDSALHSLLGFQSQGFRDSWGPHPRRARGYGRRRRPLRTRDLRRRRREGRSVFHHSRSPAHYPRKRWGSSSASLCCSTQP